MTDERYHHGWADRPPADVGWTLVPGEMIQRAGFAYDTRVPAGFQSLVAVGQRREPKLGIAAASSANAWWEVQRISSRQLLEAARHGRLPGAPLVAQPQYWAATEGSRVLMVWPPPDKRYAAAWL